MMREIKFRAWQKHYKEMLSHKRIEYGAAVELHNLDKDVVLMQYTGLKDKNGKSLYEGDIVNIFDPLDEGEPPRVYKIVFEALGLTKTMGFHGVSVDGRGHDDFYGGIPGNSADEIEVIGNIYQDAHLIKEGKE